MCAKIKEMIVYNIALALLVLAAANAGTNKSALGLNASRLNTRIIHHDESHPTFVDFGHGEHGEPTGAGVTGVDGAVKWTGLRGSTNVVDANASTEIGSNNADGTVPAKIWVKRSDRIAGALTTVS